MNSPSFYFTEDDTIKTLYLSDLDGTLLRNDQTVSDNSARIINRLISEGMLFSFATARSLITAKRAAPDLKINLPLITYNGTFMVYPETGERVLSNYLNTGAYGVIDELISAKIYPMLYYEKDNSERFSYIPEKTSRGMKKFIISRKNDPRELTVSSIPELVSVKGLFYILCIDEKDRLEPFYHRYKYKYRCLFYREQYTGEYWLEIMPISATKANAALRLKEYLGCDRLTVFGDAINDIDMFAIADECYAVANASDELKSIATGIIGSNEEDGVAQWLSQNSI